MINQSIKLCILLLVALMFRHAQKRYREEKKASARHIQRWVQSLGLAAIVASIGEYALSRGLMTPVVHLIYDIIGNGLFFVAIFHGVALPIELTHEDGKAVKKRRLVLWLCLFWLIMMGLYIPYRFEVNPGFYYAYNGLRLFVFVGLISRVIIWYHRAAQAEDDLIDRHRMNLMKYASLICLLYPLTVLPNAEGDPVRPNLLVALVVISLSCLGYIMPKWYRRVLYLFSGQLPDELLRQNMALVGVVSDFFSQRPTNRFLLEQWIRRLGNHLTWLAAEIRLLVKTSYLLDVGRLYHPTLAPDGAEMPMEEEPHQVRQRSADYAAEILEFRDISRIIRHVGERWDGEGFPDGFCGREIPFFSRVLALMDAFVGELILSSDAVGALQRVKGEDGAFDPQLLAALEEMICGELTGG